MDQHKAPPVISVIAAVHNVADHVGAMIDSLRAQSFAAFEVVIVDDGSTDGSEDLVRTLSASDPRFRVIRQDNAGLSAARNTGLEAARGAFVAFIDGDDTVDPEFLRVLHRIVEQDGCDWAACGVLLCYPGGRQEAHSAIHARPAQPAGPIALSDARVVARVFPSAWNKLYRRKVFDGLRFTPATWFEDHEVFWSIASRHGTLGYSPRPLYRHRRGRAGQITGTDSDRVFEQLTVLDRVKPLVETGGFAHASEGFAQLATRLVHERAQVLRQPARRAAFLAQAQARFTDWGIAFAPGDDPQISRALRLAMQGVLPLSVVLQPRDAAGLSRALPGLAAQDMADFEVLVIGDAPPATPERLPGGQKVWSLKGADMATVLAAASGAYVLILSPSEFPLPDAFGWLINAAERSGAPMAMGGFQRATLGYHDGWTDNRVAVGVGGEIALEADQALRLYPVVGNKIFAAPLLAGLPIPDGLAQVQAFVLQAALRARRAAQTDLPVMRAPDFPAPPRAQTQKQEQAGGLVRQVRAMPVDDARLPVGWRAVVALRLYQLGLGHRRAQLGWVRLLWQVRGLRGAETLPLDPQSPGWVHGAWRLLGGGRR